MEFIEFRDRLIENFQEMTKDVSHLFEVAVDKDELWNLYLDSFPAGTNEIYRERREHDCSCCRQYIKTIGNVVVIKDNKVETIWNLGLHDDTYQPVVEALDVFIKTKVVTDVFISQFKKIGALHNFESMLGGKIKQWDHFFLELPDKFINLGGRSIGDLQGGYRDTKNVFKRSLDEITEDSVLTVLDLISQNSLYKGEEWKNPLNEFLLYKKAYEKLSSDEEKNNFTWEQSVKAGAIIGRIRNHSIGTLLINISEDMDLDLAVRKYEQIVAPSNYKRPKAIFTKKMLEDAQKTISELGYLDSLGRRYATLDDIKVNNILFSNKDAANRISGGDIFAIMAQEMSINPKKLTKVEEIPAEKFVKDVLPTAKALEVLLENHHAKNMVSLIAPENKDAKTMFKWGNGFSWAYSGNMTDSDIRQNVKSAGGAVDGVLRFSIQWNDEDYNPNDFDAHCLTPDGHIFFGAKLDRYTKGNLDVDIINPIKGTPAVENITWPELLRMTDGTYQFYVHCYSHNGGRSGFKAEIEFNGQIYSFEYNKELRNNEKVHVANVKLNNGVFTMIEKLQSSASSREVWGIKTNQFAPVSVMMYSPNYWDEQDEIGHRHYMFMLKDCVNTESPNGMFNEYLKQELVQHKRVFEALGAKCRVKDTEYQLSGIGFSATKRNDVIVKVKGTTERTLKIKF